MNKKAVYTLGFPISTLSLEETLDKIEEMIEGEEINLICTANVDHLVRLQSDSDFRKVYKKADLIVADGMPLVWISPLFGRKISQRVTGVDLLEKFVELAAKKNYRVFFLGGTANVLNKAVKNLKSKHGDFKVKIWSPSFADRWSKRESLQIVKQIKKFKPHALFVGVGAPKQEGWIYEHLDELAVPMAMGVGGAFEFLAGTKKRAPKWVQNSGFEWLFRLIHEPNRLWKRYLVRDLMFPFLAIKDLLTRGK